MHGLTTGNDRLNPLPHLSPHPSPHPLSQHPLPPPNPPPCPPQSPHPIVLHSFLKEMWHFSLYSVTHSTFFRFSITVFSSQQGTLTHLVRFSMTVSVTCL